jgi:hypothetical protein
MIRSVLPSGDAPFVSPNGRKSGLAVTVQDYFQAPAVRSSVPVDRWYRFESRLEAGVSWLLGRLAQWQASATWFIDPRTISSEPELVRRVVRAGHLVGAAWCGTDWRQMDRERLIQSLARVREQLAVLAGRRIHGFRLADSAIGPGDEWLWEVAARAGFMHDSSPLQAGTLPIKGAIDWFEPVGLADWPDVDLPSDQPRGRGSESRQGEGQVLSVATWELDPGQPRIATLERRVARRHYRRVEQGREQLEEVLKTASWGPLEACQGAAFLRDETHSETPDRSPNGRQTSELVAESHAGSRTPITIVVPCFNEEGAVGYLANTLRSVRERLSSQYEVRLVIVDDGSSDGTWSELQTRFGDWADCMLLRHAENQGVSAAILTGLRQASTEVVCSIDSDCTYDPFLLTEMIPLLTDDVALVTASPYHPLGRVQNVPGWRLMLSRSASWLYRRVLRTRLATYTSCFRVYRRSVVAPLSLTEPRFLGVAELVGELDYRGARVVEHPAVLEARVLGRSKMRIVRTILGHVGLLGRLLWARLARLHRVDGIGPGFANKSGL